MWSNGRWVHVLQYIQTWRVTQVMYDWDQLGPTKSPQQKLNNKSWHKVIRPVLLLFDRITKVLYFCNSMDTDLVVRRPMILDLLLFVADCISSEDLEVEIFQKMTCWLIILPSHCKALCAGASTTQSWMRTQNMKLSNLLLMLQTKHQTSVLIKGVWLAVTYLLVSDAQTCTGTMHV